MKKTSNVLKLKFLCFILIRIFLWLASSNKYIHLRTLFACMDKKNDDNKISKINVYQKLKTQSNEEIKI